MSDSRTIRLDLEYDGADFVGWQMQNEGRSVQGELARCLSTFLQEDVVPVAAGRTDAGTHALGQVAHFHTESLHPPDRMVRALNSLLPDDVAVTAASEVGARFHARYSALSKRYRYRIDTRKGPLERRFVWNLYRPLDCDAMIEASQSLMGVHSFRAFCNSDPQPKSYECDILDTSWKWEGPEISFEIEANRFLRHMVRIIIGTLVDVGEGRLTPATFADLLLLDGGSERSAAGATAPAQGLCLLRVHYPED